MAKKIAVAQTWSKTRVCGHELCCLDLHPASKRCSSPVANGAHGHCHHHQHNFTLMK
jgi:hypothetical protein